ncbi:hypothetical protein RvVAT039_pl02670 (plasmid) [Agrobacterium vitis]|nr:hypothetical protein RvVAT039_pl02670 [Agrobacterium vitis]
MSTALSWQKEKNVSIHVLVDACVNTQREPIEIVLPSLSRNLNGNSIMLTVGVGRSIVEPDDQGNVDWYGIDFEAQLDHR